MGIYTNEPYTTVYGITLPNVYISFKNENISIQSSMVNIYDLSSLTYTLQKQYLLQGNYGIYANNDSDYKPIAVKNFNIVVDPADINLSSYTIGYNYLKKIYPKYTDDFPGIIETPSNINSNVIETPSNIIETPSNINSNIIETPSNIIETLPSDNL